RPDGAGTVAGGGGWRGGDLRRGAGGGHRGWRADRHAVARGRVGYRRGGPAREGPQGDRLQVEAAQELSPEEGSPAEVHGRTGRRDPAGLRRSAWHTRRASAPAAT